MAADTLREKLTALVGELHQQASIYRRGQELWDERQALVYTQVARKLAAILAESEEPKPKERHPRLPAIGNDPSKASRSEWDAPEGQTHYVGDDCEGGHAEVGEMKPEAKVKLPLGHEFKTWTWGALAGANTYCYSCGQPRSAHEPK